MTSNQAKPDLLLIYVHYIWIKLDIDSQAGITIITKDKLSTCVQ